MKITIDIEDLDRIIHKIDGALEESKAFTKSHNMENFATDLAEAREIAAELVSKNEIK